MTAKRVRAWKPQTNHRARVRGTNVRLLWRSRRNGGWAWLVASERSQEWVRQCDIKPPVERIQQPKKGAKRK